MKKWMILICALLMILILSGCGCEHEWVDANCDTPKTCSLCQEIEGEPLGHSWQDATCTAPKTCTACSLTEGDMLAHTPGEMVTTIDYIQALESQTQSCTVCTAVLSSSESTISLVKDGMFLLSAEDLVARLNSIYAAQGKTDWSASLEMHNTGSNEYFMLLIRHDDIIYGWIFLQAPENDPDTKQVWTEITQDQTKEQILNSVLITINYSEIARQLHDSDTATQEQNAIWLIETYSEADVIFQDVLAPLYLALSPTLPEEEISAAVKRGLDGTFNFYSADILYQEACGDFYAEYINYFGIMGVHMINLSTTPDYWMEPNND